MKKLKSVVKIPVVKKTAQLKKNATFDHYDWLYHPTIFYFP